MAVLTLGFDGNPIVGYAIWAVLLSVAVMHFVSTRKVHPNEPTIVPPRIPIVGHLLGMVLHGGQYTKHLG